MPAPKIILGTLAALVFLASAAPAFAADVAGLSCPAQGLTSEMRETLRLGAKDLVARKKDTTIDPSVLDAISHSIRQCREKLGWSKAASEAAVWYTIMSVMLPVLEDAVRADGYAPDAVERVFRALPASVIAQFLANSVPQDASLALMAALEKARIQITSHEAAFHVGTLAGAIAYLDQSKADFLSA